MNLQGSLKPWHIWLGNLPPWIRYNPAFMLCFAIINNKLKMESAKKYYDFAATYEMNELHRTGIYGVRIIMYGTSLDCPGRRELLSMQSVQAYYPCPTCLHTWQPGPSTLIYGGYRRFLPQGHPWRAKTFRVGDKTYEFIDVESRPPAIKRTDTLSALAAVRARPNAPFLGHKALPLLWNWLGADWGRSMPDQMHDLKCFSEMCMKGLVGRASDGFYKNWGSRDDAHRAVCQKFGIFNDFVEGALPPWRLTRAQVNLMDKRVKSMWWPHYTDKLCFKGHSFWKKTDRIWKAKHRLFVLLTILPTCLRGFVKATHFALLHIIDALRQLEGQRLAVHEALQRGIDPHDSHVVDEREIQSLGRQLLKGLLLLEGSFPVTHLNPIMHHLVHYAAETARVGSAAWTSMNSFERNNKRMKGMVRSNRFPEASLANDTQVDIAARATSLDEVLRKNAQPPPLFKFCLKPLPTMYFLSKRQKYCLSMLGVQGGLTSVRSYMVARIKGMHFSCGEWGQRTCGSVFTTVYRGRSRYGILDRFLFVRGKEYAAVTWLSPPVYPYHPITVVVRVSHQEYQPLNRCVIPCDRIEPCGICVMPDEDGVHYYMMRDRGFDRRVQ